MKVGIHPEFKKTKVSCSGCGTTFDSYSTVDEISVEICSNCHPFYTGKQKLVDTAGRVDRFRAQTQKAAKLQAQKTAATTSSAPKTTKLDKAELKKVEVELKTETQKINKSVKTEK